MPLTGHWPPEMNLAENCVLAGQGNDKDSTKSQSSLIIWTWFVSLSPPSMLNNFLDNSSKIIILINRFYDNPLSVSKS